MLTIGRKYVGPLYNYTDWCDYCGGKWHRTEMRLDADGLLRCPNCMSGKCLTELAEEAAASVGKIEPVRGKTREGP